MTVQTRCAWVTADPLYLRYHDVEWGVPVHDEQALFERVVLEGMQAGVSWLLVLRKRENFRRAFDNFNPHKVAAYDEAKVQALLQDAGIIRNAAKIRAAVSNANAFLDVAAEYGSFDKYLWGFVDGRPLQNRWATLAEVPAKTPLSEKMSKEMKRRGFKFVGSVICYSIMQAVGMVNDHVVSCFRHVELGG